MDTATPIYMLYISGVDGTSLYTITTLDKEAALSFLRNYDHEGSSLSMTVYADKTDIMAGFKDLDGEAVLKELNS